MSFPNTQHSLIQRIATSGKQDDWQEFLFDYWSPVCRFAARWGKLGTEDAEDVASAAFEVIIHNKLLSRWVSDRKAKLRTLLCAVVRNILSNRARVNEARSRRLVEHHGELDRLLIDSIDVQPVELDVFYSAWAEGMLQASVEALQVAYHREGRGNYFRVLFGRICDEMTSREIAESLNLKVSSVENYFNHARKRLGELLEQMLSHHVERYCVTDDVEQEKRLEWQNLGEFLKRHGGLEQALQRTYQDFDAEQSKQHAATAMTKILANVQTELKRMKDKGP